MDPVLKFAFIPDDFGAALKDWTVRMGVMPHWLTVASIPVNDNRCIQGILNYSDMDNIVENFKRQTLTH